MALSNLPPGCRESDIPGNRPEEVAWEEFHEQIDSDMAEHCFDVDDLSRIWKACVALYLELHKDSRRS